MDYEYLLKEVRDKDKDQLKKMIFDAEQTQIEQIKNWPIDDVIKRGLILMLKDRTFLEVLLVNSLK